MATAIQVLASKVTLKAGEARDQITVASTALGADKANQVVSISRIIEQNAEELADTNSQTSEALEEKMGGIVSDYKKSIKGLVSNSEGVRDSLGEIRTELAADAEKFEGLIEGANKEVKNARDAELARFGQTSEFVISLDETYSVVSL